MHHGIAAQFRTFLQTQLPSLAAFRHRLHQHPELALQEVRTRAAIREMLAETAIHWWNPLLGTDLIGELPGASDRVIVLRADIDCIAAEEQSDLPYRSCVPGVMHGCGHDGHVAMLVGAALALDAVRERLPVTVRFVFQPGEEMACAGKDLVAAGACRDAEAAYALHGWPGVPAGVFSSRPGVLFAAGALFTCTMQGRGCHGAMPERGCNPIPVAARLITCLQALHDRLHAAEGAVLSVCQAHAGSSGNVIPDSASVQGTYRYLRAELGEEIVREIRAICRRLARRSGVAITVNITHAYPLPVVNTPAGYARARDIVETHWPDGAWREAEAPTMAMEDFAFYLPERDGAMIWLGVGESAPPLHAPNFNFPDAVLVDGALLLSLLPWAT